MNLSEFILLVNQQYLCHYDTVLIGGFSEPLYLPAQAGQPAVIQFTHDYFRSALHELAHWCEAGVARRKLVDYGYWYAPDGRNQAQQQAFFQHEIVPQAFEWALSMAAGVKFEVSVDNLTQTVSGEAAFKTAVRQRLAHYIDNGFPQRVDALLRLIFQARTEQGDIYAALRAQSTAVSP
jgi:elongation factor P hydroxylase